MPLGQGAHSISPPSSFVK